MVDTGISAIEWVRGEGRLGSAVRWPRLVGKQTACGVAQWPVAAACTFVGVAARLGSELSNRRVRGSVRGELVICSPAWLVAWRPRIGSTQSAATKVATSVAVDPGRSWSSGARFATGASRSMHLVRLRGQATGSFAAPRPPSAVFDRLARGSSAAIARGPIARSSQLGRRRPGSEALAGWSRCFERAARTPRSVHGQHRSSRSRSRRGAARATFVANRSLRRRSTSNFRRQPIALEPQATHRRRDCAPSRAAQGPRPSSLSRPSSRAASPSG